MKFLLGIRTNNVDYQTISLLSYYKSNGIDCILCIDELKEEYAKYDLEKISINSDFIKENQLDISISKPLLWNCGDYFLYGMFSKYPDYDGYWLLEDDALVKHENLKEFLSKPIRENVDFSASAMNLLSKEKDWEWKKSIQKTLNIEEVYACLFSVVFVSRRFVEEAFKKRVENCKIFKSDYSDYLYPNDEGFMMNYLDKNKFKYKSLRDIYGFFYTNNLKFSSSGDVFYFNQLLSNNDSGFYHPIVIDQEILSSISRDIKINKKQKKDISDVLNKYKIDLSGLNSEVSNNKFFCFIFYGLGTNKNLIKNLLKPTSVFFIEENISDDKFFEELKNIVENNDKFYSFILIDRDVEIANKNYLNFFSYPALSNDKIKIYYNKKNKMVDKRFSIFSRNKIEDFKKILNNNYDIDNLDFLNNYIEIEEYFNFRKK
ncbi:hypothetical protein [Acinetobacter terrae]|uniref:Glycosyl transferase n=1 Tax=Acinetobacter terrae TaxID=2731247 RepID=A0A8E4F9F5_9GAMM|nr:hypothetical protein [Acinetobacter terrae]NNH38907.1 hypothetical protein [Acinetobacter terrae]